MKLKTIKGRKVEFEYFAPEALAVQLAGNFNDWNPDAAPLKKDFRGYWRTSLNLPPGRYEYRYRVDGQWQNDQRAVECAPNAFGSWNCVMEVQ